jgi:hypothetical protein
MLVATLQVQASNPPPVIVKKGPCGGVTICHLVQGLAHLRGVLPNQGAGDGPERRSPVRGPSRKCTACHFCDTHWSDLAVVVCKLA